MESRRVNGKPRPIILEYLGTADTLLRRLNEGVPKKVRSYTHGSVAVMLAIAEELQIVETINKHLKVHPFRDGFTVGGSLLLAAVGRICQPTSKRNWYEGWARNTSLSYLLRMSLSRLDSQHFWDQMDALPSEVIPLIEEDIVTTLLKNEQVSLDTLLCDTTNFFTHIDSTNHRCSIAQRGKNKQKRMDLRQFGLLLLVSRQDHLPMFHKVYQGNLVDRTVFREHFMSVIKRFKAISGSLEDITLVFDQGNNSKKMLKDVSDNIHFVGALSPHQHKALVKEANNLMEEVTVNGRSVQCCELQKTIWGLDLKVVVYISEPLRKGQLRGIEQQMSKLFTRLEKLRAKIAIPTKRGKKRTQSDLEKKISSMINSSVPKDIVLWELRPLEKDSFDLRFWVNNDELNYLREEWLGRRILITNRHTWNTEQIISAYWGQSNVENAFKNMKNPFHLAMRPQYHWTDQKIEVHAFICLLAFLLVMIAYKRAKEQTGFTGSPHTLLEKLSAIRLATFIERPKAKTKGRYKATYQLEDMDPDILDLAQGMGVTDMPLKTSIPFSVYN
ncbi:MAG: IS1634 family transposase [Desulfatiglandales bacterium]